MLEQLKAILREILDASDELEALGIERSLEDINEEIELIEKLTARIQEEKALTDVGIQEERNIPEGADLLWILSGGNPEAFKNYVQTIPDPDLQALANNPAQLQQVINRLSSQITLPIGESAEGIPHAQLQSSNVYGFQYDPASKQLLVKFQGTGASGQGPVYSYSDVPPLVAKLFSMGSAQAKTTGQNKWGKWWRFKTPSLGAAHWQFIRDRYPYQKVA